MRTSEILNSVGFDRGSKPVGLFNWLKPFLIVSAILVAAVTARADCTCAPCNCNGCNCSGTNLVATAATTLLATPMSPAQRQVVHAQNFKQLAPSLRSLYLHAVAFQVGVSAENNGQLLSSNKLADYLESVPSIYIAPAIPSEYSDLLLVHLSLVNTVLRDLNTLIAGQIADNLTYQDAMHAAGVSSFWNGTDWAW